MAEVEVDEAPSAEVILAAAKRTLPADAIVEVSAATSELGPRLTDWVGGQAGR